MYRRTALSASILASALALAGCASTTTTTVRAPSSPPAAAAAAPSSPALAAAPSATPSPSPSEADCTSRACIISDAKQLVGDVAKDESVITAMSCDQSTVKHLDPGIWSVRCTATYSDGSQIAGIATVLLTQSQVTWEPVG